MSAAPDVCRKAKQVGQAFATPAPVFVTSAMRTDATLAAEHPDADLIQACLDYPAATKAYNKQPHDEGPAWAAYENARDAISDGIPMTLDGMLAKAEAAKFDAMCPDGTERPEGGMASTWSWQLVSDLLRLYPDIATGGAEDVALIADHRIYDQLERQWIASFDHAEGTEAEALQESLRGMQAPILERMAARRAVTVEGLRARLRTVLLDCREADFADDAANTGLGLDERLNAILVRDLAAVLGVTLEVRAETSDTVLAYDEPPSITVLVKWMVHAWAQQGRFDRQALEAKKVRDKRSLALLDDASDRETRRAMALEKLILASSVKSASDAIGQIMVVLTSVTAIANELDGDNHHTLYGLVETGVVALATLSRQHGIDLSRIGADILTGRALDRIKEDVG
jgi:hypothetical protein